MSDAEHFARVLTELGGVAPANQIILRQPRLGELVDALDVITRRVSDGKRATGAAGGRTEVIVYFNGVHVGFGVGWLAGNRRRAAPSRSPD